MNASFLEAPFRCTPCLARYGNPFWIAHLKPMRSANVGATVRSLQKRFDRKDRHKPDTQPAKPTGVGLRVVANLFLAVLLEPVDFAVLVKTHDVGNLRHESQKDGFDLLC